MYSQLSPYMYTSCINNCHLYYKCHQNPATDDIHVHVQYSFAHVLHMFITEHVYNCFCLNVENCHSKFDLYMYIHVVYIMCT